MGNNEIFRSGLFSLNKLRSHQDSLLLINSVTLRFFLFDRQENESIALLHTRLDILVPLLTFSLFIAGICHPYEGTELGQGAAFRTGRGNCGTESGKK